MRKVVVVGIGAISGNGKTSLEIWGALMKGRLDRTRVTREIYFDQPPPDPDKKDFLQLYWLKSERKRVETVCGLPLTNAELFALAGDSVTGNTDRYDRHQLFAIIAANEAMADIGVAKDVCEPRRFGVMGGTGDGGLKETYLVTKRMDDEHKRLDIFSNLRQLPNIFIGHLARRYGIRGAGFVHVTACAASAHAFQQAALYIAFGMLDAALVVGTEAVVTPFGLESFAVQGAISNESKPYQKDRKGFLMGEGAGALVLVEKTLAKKLGLPILAQVAGFGASTDGNADISISALDPTGAAEAVELALKMACIRPSELGYLNTHGTGTREGDKGELAGMSLWAGDSAREIPLSSTKSSTGHLLGAAGALESVFSVKALQTGLMPPTAGLTPENLDPEFAEFRHVMGLPYKLHKPFVMNNSFGFGGANSSIIFEAA